MTSTSSLNGGIPGGAAAGRNSADRQHDVPPPESAMPVMTPGPGLAPGERLAGAFAAAEAFPVSIDARDRITEVAVAGEPTVAELSTAVETDLGLALAAIRRVCRQRGTNAEVSSVEHAVALLRPSGVLAAVAGVPTYDPLGFSEVADPALQRLRAHSLSTQAVARLIATELRMPNVGEVALAALLHDIGRLVVIRLHPGYDPDRNFATRSPEQRFRDERDRYGIDHALVGGVMARRWNLPDRVAVAIERHHSDEASGLEAVVALSDQIAHNLVGDAVSLERLKRLSREVGLSDDQLRGILSRPVTEAPVEVARRPEPCPLSDRERDALARLSEGKVYKQIAEELDLTVSTVRTHLHNIYRKLEVVDRAQAVIKARDQGWI